MDILEEGKGELLGFHDPDEQRAWVAANKSTALVDKRMTVAEAVERFIPDGSYIASGGFGHIRVAMSVIYEIIRQQAPQPRDRRQDRRARFRHPHRRGMHLEVRDRLLLRPRAPRPLPRLAAGGRIGAREGRRRDVERRLPVALPRGDDGRAVRPRAEPPRHRHAEILVRESRRSIPSPESRSTLIPSANPDVVLMHVPRCDKYGNCQIDGILVMDYELARSARRLIVTTERDRRRGGDPDATRGAP